MITTITLNASIDKAYYIDGPAENGHVMRVKKVINTAGGKGLNVARSVLRCGAQVQATGFCGGFNGRYLEDMLDKDGVKNCFVHVKAETRSCINILDEKYGSTEYLEPGEAVDSDEIDDFLDLYNKILIESNVITISGSMPKGVPGDFYGKLIEKAKDHDKKILLDTSGATLKNSIPFKPTMIKPNQEELEAILERKLDTREKLIDAAVELQATGIEFVAISLGGDGALLVCAEGVYHGMPPKIEVVNTVGCGDSMVGAFAVAFERGDAPEEALRFAIAVASSNAMSAATGDVNMEIASKLMKDTVVEKIR